MLSCMQRVIATDTVNISRTCSAAVSIFVSRAAGEQPTSWQSRRHFVTTPYRGAEASKSGGPKKTSMFSVSGWRSWVSEESDNFKPASGRYHLYVSYACPWAQRTLIVRKLKGLEKAISFDVVHWLLTDKGWLFDDSKPAATIDSVNNFEGMGAVYKKADPEYKGKYTVPVLWDKQMNTMVNNKSKDILRMLNANFQEFCETDEQRQLDLYPSHHQEEIDDLTDFISPNLTKGVYKAGRAITQPTYEKAAKNVFMALDKFEDILSQKRYLCGDQMTEIDVKLYSCLIRFDTVYHGHFKCNKKRIIDYPNLWAYTRELYQIPAFKDTTNFEHIAKFYQESQLQINPHGIVALGPELDLDAPHGRDKLGQSTRAEATA
ncbi:hypothetical protein NP493_71g01001 [Ridgeia piscesae]|uniref:GST C-terminal domain-containing protein n=1 Tax=Ridgeia piscesae TaxID=27915 RepID=A0AAD9P9N2_RIDPI|nr:hypothetical protein NP493_71g01001 [Ridgeia piscesae]